MSYTFLQQYWWFIVSLLGALLVFLLFVQGANSLVYTLGSTEDGQRKVLESTGRKWEITFTTLVTFGGAFFASFPLFYSTSFGGAYWLWMIILFSFVLQAVSYEFQLKRGNLLGTRTYRYFLILNGIFGPLLLGGAVATFFNGSNFIVDKASLTSVGSPVISRWANASAGLDALLDPWNLMLGLAVMFLARILGTLYIINNVEDEAIHTRGRRQLLVNTVPFLAFFLAFFIRTLLKDGYVVNAETGMIFMEPMKYLHNYLALWPTAVLTLVGVLLLLYGIVRSLLHSAYTKGIWPAASVWYSSCCVSSSVRDSTTRPSTPPTPTCRARSPFRTVAAASLPCRPWLSFPSLCHSSLATSPTSGASWTARNSLPSKTYLLGAQLSITKKRVTREPSSFYILTM